MRYCPSCHSVYPNEFRTCPKDQADLLTASELQPGMVLRGKYEILGKLGAGGMAAVYRARHLAFGEVRAIKVVNNRLADDEDFLRRFRNEAVVARRLHHPNAVRVDDLDVTEDGRPFIVMEYVEGYNLREVVRREGALSLRRSVRIARQVASALAAAHELGIVHRDIKPDNILLTGAGEDETAKVLDFGIAKMKESALGDSGAVATRTGMVVGTPQYISPEQAMGRKGSELDGRADLYSLGVVLYEMVTGRLPFESDTAMGIILHHLQTPPPAPRDVRPDLGIPEPLSDVLMRALEKDPQKRFASAAAMSVALDDVLALPLPERLEPEGAAAERGPMGSARPLTPRPIPSDIDRHETRVMPKTPPLSGPTAVTSAATASRTPPPLPHTPVPAPTFASGRSSAAWTPVPSPTIVTPAGGASPLPGGAGTPPPLPLSAPGPAPRAKGRPWPWWVWVIGAVVLIDLLNKGRVERHRNDNPQPSPAAAQSGSAEGDARAARDAQIMTSVQHALRSNPRTRREDIDVEVDEGFVTLSGNASAAAAHEAEAVTRRVDGVREVVNGISVEGGEDAGGNAVPVPPIAPPAPGPVEIPRGPVADPHGPPGHHGLTPADPETIHRLLKEAHEAARAGNAGEALGKFGAVMRMDPHNDEALRGMKDATILLGETIRRRVMPSPAS